MAYQNENTRSSNYCTAASEQQAHGATHRSAYSSAGAFSSGSLSSKGASVISRTCTQTVAHIMIMMVMMVVIATTVPAMQRPAKREATAATAGPAPWIAVCWESNLFSSAVTTTHRTYLGVDFAQPVLRPACGRYQAALSLGYG